MENNQASVSTGHSWSLNSPSNKMTRPDKESVLGMSVVMVWLNSKESERVVNGDYVEADGELGVSVRVTGKEHA